MVTPALQLGDRILAQVMDGVLLPPRHVVRKGSAGRERAVGNEGVDGAEKGIQQLRLPPQEQKGCRIIVIDRARVSAATKALYEQEGPRRNGG